MFGTLKIAVSQDIGDLGPETGAEVDYPWPLYRHFASLLPGLVVLLLLFARQNRNRQAWLVLIPVAVSGAVFYLPFRVFSSFGDGGGSPVNISSQLFGLATLWLLGDWLSRFARLKALLVAAVIMVIFTVSEALLQGSGASLLHVSALIAIGPILALVLAAYWCRRRFSRARYIGMLACACVAVMLSVIVTSIALFLVNTGGFAMRMLLSVLIGVPMIAGVTSIFLFVFLLPFVLLSFYSSLYRQRFMSLLRLNPVPDLPERSAPRP